MTTNLDDKYLRALKIARSKNPDFYKARDLLFAAHSERDTRATYAIASWYLNGNIITDIDEKAGLSMLLELEMSNISEALFDLAIAYDLGRGVKQNESKAFSYYMRSALLGNREACQQIAQFYFEGKVVNFDKELGDAWVKRSQQDEADISPPYRVRLD